MSVAAANTSLLDKTRRIMDQLKQGEFVAGMEEFYADDVVCIESTGTRTEGKATIIANERELLKRVKAFNGIKVISMGGHDDGAGNGTTFAEYNISVDMKDGTTFNPDQVHVIRWRDGKVYENRFYYNPSL